MKKRILVLLTVVALMLAMVAMSVTPAFADPANSCNSPAWFKTNFKVNPCPGLFHPTGPPSG